MKKTLILLLITVMLCIASVPCLAADGYIGGEYLLDDADLLSASEEDSILEELASLSEEFGCNVGIITVDHLDQSALSYAHGQYDAIYGGQTYDGILLVINMEAGDREWGISFNGKYASYDDYDLMSSSVIIFRREITTPRLQASPLPATVCSSLRNMTIPHPTPRRIFLPALPFAC